MKRTLPKRSNLFLMEMILAILFFSLASAVCMQLFVKARILSENTSAQNHAMVLAKSAASAFEAGDGTLTSLQEDYPESLLEDSRLRVYYDDDWNLCAGKEKTYEMCITIEAGEGNLTSALIAVKGPDDTELFCLEASCYQPIKAVME